MSVVGKIISLITLRKNTRILRNRWVILAESPEVPENGLAVRDDLDPTLKNRLKDVLLNLDKTEEGRLILQQFGAKRFIETTDKDYASLYKMVEELGIDLKTYPSCYKITHDRDSICEQPNDICPIRESLEGHEPCVELHTHLNKEGREVSVNGIAATVKNKLGKTSYYLHLAKEVKKEEEKGRLLQGDLERIKRLTDKLESYVMRLEEEKIFTEGTMEKLMSLGAVENVEIYYKTKAGGVIPVSFSGSVMRGKEGEMVGIVGIARDMREIKSLLQKEKKLVAEAEESAERERAKAAE